MLIRLRGAGCPNSAGTEQSYSKPFAVLKGQPYFYTSSPTANSKSVLRIWRPTNEKVRKIKPSTCASHHYGTLFIGGQERKMGLMIRFMFYWLALSTFLWGSAEMVVFVHTIFTDWYVIKYVIFSFPFLICFFVQMTSRKPNRILWNLKGQGTSG